MLGFVLQACDPLSKVPGGRLSISKPGCRSPIQEQKGKGPGSGAREFHLYP